METNNDFKSISPLRNTGNGHSQGRETSHIETTGTSEESTTQEIENLRELEQIRIKEIIREAQEDPPPPERGD
jgi:hypothetical protein